MFKDMIDDYISFCRLENALSQRTIDRYEFVLSVFMRYISTKFTTTEELISLLSDFSYNELLESLDQYITINRVKAEDTCLFYLTVLREFFKYQKQTGAIHCDKLISSFGLLDSDVNSFNFNAMAYIKKLIDKNIIKRSDSGPPYNDNEVNSIISYCNKKIGFPEKGKPLSDARYNSLVLALITKLIVLTGVSVSKIYKLSIGNLIFEKNLIQISGCDISLPKNLEAQLRDYLLYVYKGDANEKDNPLFLDSNNNPFTHPRTIGDWIKNPLLKLKDRPLGSKNSSTICLAKHTIIRLIDQGVDRDTLAIFTGYKDTVLAYCKDNATIDRLIESLDDLTEKLKVIPEYFNL